MVHGPGLREALSAVIILSGNERKAPSVTLPMRLMVFRYSSSTLFLPFYISFAK